MAFPVRASALLVAVCACAPDTLDIHIVPADNDVGAGDAASAGGDVDLGDPTGGDPAPGDAASTDDARGDLDVGGDTDPPCSAVHVAPLLTFNLDNGAFPNSGHPDVAVHIPDGYNPCAGNGLVVYFHGFSNCVVNVMGNTPSECTPAGPLRAAHSLIDQFDAAGINAILVAVELEFDVPSGDPGALADAGRFYALLDELASVHLEPLVGRNLAAQGFRPLVVASHSGGYQAAATVLEVGGADITEVQLYDSLYGYLATFEGFVATQVGDFELASPTPRRLATVYTAGGGTATNNRTLEADVESDLQGVGLLGVLLDDDTTSTWTDADFAEHTVFFKRSALSHDGVVPYYFLRFVRSAAFAPLP